MATSKTHSAPTKHTTNWKAPGLPALVANLGDATRDEVEVYLGGVSRDERIAAGRRVVTTRIDDDGERVVRIAGEFLSTAPTDAHDDPRDSVDLSVGVVRVLAWSLLQGHLAYRELVGDRVTHKGEQQALSVTAENLTARLRLQRNKLATLIRNASGQDPAVVTKVTNALRPVASGAVEVGPDASIHALVAVGRALLKKGTAPDDQKRFTEFKLTEAKLKQYEMAATEAGPTLSAAGAPSVRSTVSQAEVDLLDGNNLRLLEIVTDAFNAGAELDHRVPRLGIVSLQGVLTSHAKSNVTSSDTSTTPDVKPDTPPTK